MKKLATAFALCIFYSLSTLGAEIIEVKLSNGKPFFDCDLEEPTKEELKECEELTRTAKQISNVELKITHAGPTLILPTEYRSRPGFGGLTFAISAAAIEKSKVSLLVLMNVLSKDTTKLSCLRARELWSTADEDKEPTHLADIVCDDIRLD